MLNRQLLAEARSQRRLLAAGLLFNLLASASIIAQALLIARIINAVFLGGQTLTAVWPLMLWLAAAIAARSLAAGAGEAAARQTGIQIKRDLRPRLMQALALLGPAAVQREHSGELAATATEGIEGLQAYFSEYLPAIVQAAALPLFVLLAVFPLDPLSGLVFLLTAPLIPLFMVLIGKLAEQSTQRQWKTLGRLSAHFLDIMQGLTTLKLFGRSREQANTIRSVSNEYAQATLSVLRVAFLSALALEWLATLSTAVIAVEIGLRLLYSRLAFEQALFILILAPEFYAPLRNLGARFHPGMAGVAAATRIFAILDQPAPKPGSLPAPSRIETISFEEVAFQYPHATAPTLQHLTFNLKPGSFTALSGPTGSGKSTVMNLLLGFLRPTSGVIRINACDLNQIDADAWRSLLAWVPQKPYLFQASIAANLRVARPHADEAALWRALEQAQLAETVRAFPQQLETPVGERGAQMSGGQAQRLALARAYLRTAPILLLDEPTAHLDSDTEAAVNAALSAWRQDRIVLAIAHRPQTIALAHQVIRLSPLPSLPIANPALYSNAGEANPEPR